MPRLDYKRCRSCGRPAHEVGQLSHTRQCAACGKAALVENIVGIATKTGPAAKRWRRALAASVGGVLLDDARPEGLASKP